MPEPLTEPPVAPTGFDFTRRDSLGVVMRDIPTLLRQTIEWIQSDPFKSMQEKFKDGEHWNGILYDKDRNINVKIVNGANQE